MVLKNKYDIVIVGAGPAGIFTALEIVQNSSLTALIIEKGKDIEKRICPMEHIKRCLNCSVCDILSGWGGAGAFSDGKLNLSPQIGGFLDKYVNRDKLVELIDYVDKIYLKYGAPDKVYEPDYKMVEKIKAQAAKNGLLFIPSKIRHIGTERCAQVLKILKDDLSKKIDIVFDVSVEKIIVNRGKVSGVELKDKRKIYAKYIVIAPGRAGSSWLNKEAKRLKLTTELNPVDIGVRVEVPAIVCEELTRICYEPKFIYYSKTFDDTVRTFCVNPYGEVVRENINGIWTVNGHSYYNHKTNNTNFAILSSTYFTEPFREPILYGQSIAKLANYLGQGVLIQRLGDLKKGRRSTEERIMRNPIQPTLKDATPGDLSFVLPYRYLVNIVEMLETLDSVMPGINSNHTLLYGVEVKLYSMRLKLTKNLETEIENLFAAGDGAGVSRGLIQASVSGILVAREILKRELR
ncbi:NAD(P)/FAD-dependent oxidoreductase [Thermodesulfovibrio yellowstonii]|uniref:NAD(P)/FAD-dependent oxidoreductase n=1 Tax=Thermodesulfovibrio yellowstonii TaxID=28262 RepID=UPI0024B3A58D|nr:NAD(P)/FAD-dependent oxidoreductase [Thermodesulfovibrio yellowstonii]MDI6865186.1 NAD(P)/FAD-dependent oxidoreductase [Thermodesulfovibrio yellowstonii]